MPRIVAGKAKGRRILVPQGVTRPTSDRTREALFSSLESLTTVAGACVLDLYAGSGAVGLEALSRGAHTAVLVESNPRAVAVLRINVAELALPGAEIMRERVERLPAQTVAAPFDIVFADPPYALAAVELITILAKLDEAGWLAADVLVVVERATRNATWTWPVGFTTVRHRRYGEGTLWYGRRS